MKEEEEEVSLIFFCACDKMIRVISKTFCRTEEEAWKSAFWGDPNSPTDDFNERRGKKNTRRRRTKSGGFFVYAADDFTFFFSSPTRNRTTSTLKRTRRATVGVAARASTTDQGNASVPKVIIDNLSDPLATILEIEFGDKLGELVDTCEAIRNLGLDISRAEITEDNQNRFYVTDHQSSEKITASARLEDLRQVVLTSMCYYHPEAQDFVQQTARNSKPDEVTDEAEAEYVTPTKKKKQIVPTSVKVTSVANGTKSKLLIETTDRPGLLSEIVRVLKDLNLNVVQAEIDTIGAAAVDTMLCTYHGKALNSNMEQLVVNTLQYYLSRLDREESY